MPGPAKMSSLSKNVLSLIIDWCILVLNSMYKKMHPLPSQICTQTHIHTHTIQKYSELIYLSSLLISVFSSKSRALMEDCSLSRGATTERVTPLITTTRKAESGDNHRDLQWLDSEDGCSQESHRTVDRTRSIHSWIQLTAHNHARLGRVLPNHCNYLSHCHQ